MEIFITVLLIHYTYQLYITFHNSRDVPISFVIYYILKLKCTQVLSKYYTRVGRYFYVFFSLSITVYSATKSDGHRF